MPKARKTQVSIEATPYYHCVSRCVRRAYLCGKDLHSGQDFEHWHELFSGDDLSSRYLSAEALSSTEKQQLQLKVECWRERLIDISWFMRCLNDKIIRNDFEQLCWP